MNLAINARDAMPGGGELHFDVRNTLFSDPAECQRLGLAPGEYVTIAVRDTGCGMDAETAARIFEAFFTTKEPGRGTGLGLAIVHGIITQAHGRVEVETEPGRGTTFLLHLPRVDAKNDPTRVVPKQATLEPGTETILIAEDKPLVRRILKTALENAGYTVLEACDGKQALDVARLHPGHIDLLLTDVVMPGSGGFALYEALTAVRPATTVIFMTGHPPGAAAREDVDRSGAVCLQKPFSFDVLSRELRAVLDAPAPPEHQGSKPSRRNPRLYGCGTERAKRLQFHIIPNGEKNDPREHAHLQARTARPAAEVAHRVERPVAAGARARLAPPRPGVRARGRRPRGDRSQVSRSCRARAVCSQDDEPEAFADQPIADSGSRTRSRTSRAEQAPQPGASREDVDLVRVYLQHIGKRQLLKAHQELAIGERIENAQRDLVAALGDIPGAVQTLVALADRIRTQGRSGRRTDPASRGRRAAGRTHRAGAEGLRAHQAAPLPDRQPAREAGRARGSACKARAELEDALARDAEGASPTSSPRSRFGRRSSTTSSPSCGSSTTEFRDARSSCRAASAPSAAARSKRASGCRARSSGAASRASRRPRTSCARRSAS